MRLLKLLFAVLTVAAATVGNEMFVGRRVNRAEQERMLADAVQQLAQVPTVIGDWQMVSESQFAPRVIETLECRGHFCRTYKNQKTDQSVNVVMLVGPPGPLVAHTPEVCMDGHGYQCIAGPEPVEFGAGQAAPQVLFRTTFAVGSSGGQVAVYYGWTRGSGCEAPNWPRLELGREPMLYKIQVSTNLDTARRAGQQRDAGEEFVDEFLPILSSFGSAEARHASSGAPTDSLRTTTGRSWLNQVVDRWIW